MSDTPPALRVFWLWRAIGWFGVAGVVVLSLIPLEGPPLPVTAGDKVAHVLAYGVLAYWFGQLYDSRTGHGWVFLGLVALGAGLELVQGLLPFRGADGWDLLADTGGVLLGLWLAATRLGGLLSWLDRRLT